MVSQPQVAAKVQVDVAPPKPAYAPQKRWPLSLSIFGALAASAALWALLIVGISWVIGLVS
jgi:hypothetical protein